MQQFKEHWDCLENNNHYLFECRKPEQALNSCVFEKLVRNPTLYQTIPFSIRYPHTPDHCEFISYRY